MKKLFFVLGIVFSTLLLLAPDVDARGGGGRGGGGGGGRGGGAGRSFNRSPSMSRSSVSRPSPGRSQAARPSTRPSTGRPQASRPSTRPATPSGSRPGVAQRPANRQTPTRNQVQDFLSKLQGARPGQLPSDRLGQQRPGQDLRDRASTRPGQDLRDRASTRPADRLSGDRARDLANRQDLGNNIRDQIKDKFPDRGDWFDNDFWNDHNYHPPYYGYGADWWKWTTAAGLASWLRWDDYPVYYDYYPYDNYWGTTGTYGSEYQPTSEPVQYSEHAQQIETTQQESTSQEWLPLGVFALSKEKGATVTPNMYMQLALNKDGLISGAFYNTTTNDSFELEGMVDKDSKRAAWKVVDNDNAPILETGAFNLTQDEIPVRANFANGSTEQLMMVRLKDPKGS